MAENNVDISTVCLATSVAAHDGHLEAIINLAGMRQNNVCDFLDLEARNLELELIVVLYTDLLDATEAVPGELNQVI
jgi:hypothetical protein